jgi:hypothetical protein
LTHPSSIAANSIAIDTSDSESLSGDWTKSIATSPPAPIVIAISAAKLAKEQQHYSAQLSLPALSTKYLHPLFRQ